MTLSGYTHGLDITALEVVAWIVATFVLYSFSLVFYRIFLSPISHIPGPKLAAATLWYDFYFQVICGGQMFKKVQELHKQYGPIVRITPREIHIDDPTFYDTIYSASEPREKASWHPNPYFTKEAAFNTIPSDIHRTRRGTLNPFFSKSQIRKFSPWIQERADILCRRFQEYKGKDKALNLGDAFACLTADTVMEYSFAEHYNLCEIPDFYAPLNKVLEIYLRGVHLGTYFSWLPDLQIKILPRWFVKWLDPQSEVVFEWLDDIERQTAAQLSGENQKHQDVDHPTIFKEMSESTRPDPINLRKRMFDEAVVVVSAGVETTAWTLTVALFHVLNNPEILKKLKVELEEGFPDPENPPTLSELEKLPYLTAVLHEALRLSAPAGRMPRVSPDKVLTYTSPSSKTFAIPPGIAISTSNYTLHHNPTIYHSPRSFLPERWLPDPPSDLIPTVQSDGEKQKPLKYYLGSFSKGSRNCLGMNLAWAELYITLANVVRRNELDLYETGEESVTVEREFLLGRPRDGTKGVRVKVI